MDSPGFQSPLKIPVLKICILPAAAFLWSAKMTTSLSSCCCSGVNWLVRALYQLLSFIWIPNNKKKSINISLTSYFNFITTDKSDSYSSNILSTFSVYRHFPLTLAQVISGQVFNIYSSCNLMSHMTWKKHATFLVFRYGSANHTTYVNERALTCRRSV